MSYPETLEPEQTPELTLESERPKRRLPIFLAAGVVFALLVGVGAYAGYNVLFPASQPAERMPASVIAYASVDLDPSLGQTVKLLNLARKFPKAKDNATDPDRLLEELLKDLKIKGFDIKQDLLSWAGDQIGIAFWLDGKDRPYGLLAISSEDDAKAKAGLQKIADRDNDEFGYVVKDGFALIAAGEKDSQAAVEEAANAAAARPLSKEAKFTNARNKLDDDQLLVFWADLDRYGDAMKAFMPKEALEGMPKDALGTYKGIVVVGVRATDSGLEANFRTSGMDKPKSKPVTDAVKQLGDLPASSQVGAVGSIPEDLGQMNGLPFSPMALLGGFGGGMEPDFEPDSELTQKERDELSALMMKKKPTPAEQKRLIELLTKDRGFEEEPAKGPDIMAAIGGAVFSISVQKLDGKVPVAKIVATLKDATKLGDLKDAKMKVTIAGNTVTAVTDGYSDGGPKLADDETFRKATAGAPGETGFAIYANLSELITGKARAELSPLRAVAVVQGYDNEDMVGVVRLIIA